jgi:hypothetical protein
MFAPFIIANVAVRSRQSILNALTDRLREATVAENYACLLDSCIECQHIYAPQIEDQ